jgi:hypothetical protein
MVGCTLGGNLLASRSSGTAYDVMPQSTTTYYAEAATANCTSAARIPVTVSVTTPLQPFSAIATPDSIACYGSSNLTANGPGDIINWYDAPQGGNLLSTTANGATYTVLPSSTTNYYAETAKYVNQNPIITEVCHYKTSTGAPLSGWPAYLIADDYIEISGSPGFDLGGYTLEQWDASVLVSTYTFSSGTVLSPAGTAIIAVGQMGSSVEVPSSYYYHGNGAYTGSFGSSGVAGRILKNPSGTIIDAVAYSGSSGYTFPPASSVGSSHWTGQTPNGASTCGIRLTGQDMNNQMNWALTDNVTYRQDPNLFNSGVVINTGTLCVSDNRTAVMVYVQGPQITTANATPQTINCNSSTNLTGTGNGNFVGWYDAPVGGNLIGITQNGESLSASPVTTTTYYAEAGHMIVSSPFITEVCHYKTTTGAPSAGWPAYLIADDYIEITGAPGFNLTGYTLEQWDASSMLSTYTFPAGTVLSPSGTAIFAVGQMGSSVEIPASFYYHANGGYASSFSSSGVAGRILKDTGGDIVDVVVYSGSSTYTFPVAAGVSSAHWSGQTPNGASTCGIRLTGADLNNQSNWVLSDNATYRQDPQILNSGVSVQPAMPPCLGNTRTPVTVNVTLSSPLTGVIASPDTICPNAFSDLSGISSGNTIRWYDSPSGGNLIGTSPSGVAFTVSTDTSSVYYAEAWDGSCFTSPRTHVDVFVNNVAQRSVTAPLSTCPGNSEIITLNNSETGVTYQLFNQNTGLAEGSAVIGNGSDLSIQTGPLNSSTSYVVTASAGGCTPVYMNNSVPSIITAPAISDIVNGSGLTGSTCHIYSPDSWVSFVNGNDLIISLFDASGGNDLETTSAEVNVLNSANPFPFGSDYYMRKVFSATPSSNGQAGVKLYFNQNDLNDLISVEPGIIDVSDLAVSKFESGTWNNQVLYSVNNGNLVITPDDPLPGIYSAYMLVNGFSDFYIHKSNYSPLPVTLLQFDAVCKDRTIQIYWTTASEENSDYFIVETSEDMLSWKQIAKVNAAGNSISTSHYSYDYYVLSAGTNYFRLKQYDYDGASENLGYTVSSCEGNEIAVLAYPNPFTDHISIIDNYFSGENIRIIITDISGKIVYESNLIQKSRELIINTGDFSPGFYHLNLIKANETLNFKLIKN